MKFTVSITQIIRKIRYILWKKKLNSCGKDVVCCSKVVMHFCKNISVGDNCRIGEACYFSGQGGIFIGNNVVFGPKVMIWSSNHEYENPKRLPFSGMKMKPVVIKDNVWVGANVNIVPGVTIEEGAVIGMGAVVTKDVPYCAVVGGNPAKVIKYRNIESYEKLKLKK